MFWNLKTLVVGISLLTIGFVIFVIENPFLRFSVSSNPSATDDIKKNYFNLVPAKPLGVILSESSSAPSFVLDKFRTFIQNGPVALNLPSSGLVKAPDAGSGGGTISGFKPLENEFLPLPTPDPNESPQNPDGMSSVADYLNYFGAHDKEINFPFGKFDKVLKDKFLVPFFPAQLVNLGLRDGRTDAIHTSLLVMRDFLTAKIDFLKSIRVRGDAWTVNQEMMGLDRLTLTLAQKYFDFENGQLAKYDLGNYFERYKNTVVYYNSSFNGQYGSTLGVTDGFWAKLARVFFPEAFAQIIGAQIAVPLAVNAIIDSTSLLNGVLLTGQSQDVVQLFQLEEAVLNGVQRYLILNGPSIASQLVLKAAFGKTNIKDYIDAFIPSIPSLPGAGGPSGGGGGGGAGGGTSAGGGGGGAGGGAPAGGGGTGGGGGGAGGAGGAGGTGGGGGGGGGLTGSTPFGGLIISFVPCICELGINLFIMPVGKNEIAQPLFLSYAVMASPLFFSYKSPVPGAWILGRYMSGELSCSLLTVINGCTNLGNSKGFIVMAGTSL